MFQFASYRITLIRTNLTHQNSNHCPRGASSISWPLSIQMPIHFLRRKLALQSLQRAYLRPEKRTSIKREGVAAASAKMPNDLANSNPPLRLHDCPFLPFFWGLWWRIFNWLLPLALVWFFGYDSRGIPSVASWQFDHWLVWAFGLVFCDMWEFCTESFEIVVLVQISAWNLCWYNASCKVQLKKNTRHFLEIQFRNFDL